MHRLVITIYKGELNMKQYSILKLLIAGFLLYMAWPSIQMYRGDLAQLFWFSWFVFLLLVIGANLATVLMVQGTSRGGVADVKQTKVMKY